MFKIRPRVKPEGTIEMYCKLNARLFELKYRLKDHDEGAGTTVARHVPDDMAKEMTLRWNAHERLLALAELHVETQQHEFVKECADLKSDSEFIHDLKYENYIYLKEI